MLFESFIGRITHSLVSWAAKVFLKRRSRHKPFCVRATLLPEFDRRVFPEGAVLLEIQNKGDRALVLDRFVGVLSGKDTILKWWSDTPPLLAPEQWLSESVPVRGFIKVFDEFVIQTPNPDNIRYPVTFRQSRRIQKQVKKFLVPVA